MGLQRLVRRRNSRLRVPLLAVAFLVLLAGCSDETEAGRLAMPDPASEQGQHILDLWQGAWIAALVTGVIVWGLIFYTVVRFRRRSDDEIPIQTRYNLPLEIFYTLAPVVMVIVFFNHTVKVQNEVLEDDNPTNVVEVVGQQWSWTFNYGIGDMDPKADDDRLDDDYSYDEYAYEAGTGSLVPELWLPVDETTRFNLYSPDVIHDFGVPGFLMKMDVIPGRVNHYVITPNREGRLPRRVLRALRGLPLPDAVRGPRRQPCGVRRPRRRARGRRPELGEAGPRRRGGLHPGRPRGHRRRRGVTVTATASHPSAVTATRASRWVSSWPRSSRPPTTS